MKPNDTDNLAIDDDDNSSTENNITTTDNNPCTINKNTIISNLYNQNGLKFYQGSFQFNMQDEAIHIQFHPNFLWRLIHYYQIKSDKFKTMVSYASTFSKSGAKYIEDKPSASGNLPKQSHTIYIPSLLFSLGFPFKREIYILRNLNCILYTQTIIQTIYIPSLPFSLGFHFKREKYILSNLMPPAIYQNNHTLFIFHRLFSLLFF